MTRDRAHLHHAALLARLRVDEELAVARRTREEFERLTKQPTQGRSRTGSKRWSWEASETRARAVKKQKRRGP